MKKLTKRIFSLMLSALLLLPLVACSSIPGEKSEYVKPHAWNENTIPLTGIAYEPSYSRDDIPDALSRSKITADNSLGKLCSVDTSFTLTAAGETSPADILKYIKSTPAIDFSCTEADDGTFKLTPSTSLLPNTVYRLSFGGESPIASFAFQTENVFDLDSAFPADLATDVPVDTGIELRFTEAISTPLEKIGDYIEVTPKVDGEFILYPDRKTVVFAPTNKLNTNTVYTVNISSSITGIGGGELGRDISVKFRTSQSEIDHKNVTCRHNLTNSMPIFAPGDSMFLSYNLTYTGASSKDFSHRDAEVKIYKYKTAADAIAAMRDYLAVSGDYFYTDETYKYPTKGLRLVADIDVTPTSSSGSYYGARYLDLPTLDEGIYLVYVTAHTGIGLVDYSTEMQALVQVSDYVVYTESSADTLVWVNSHSGKDTSDTKIDALLFHANDGWDTKDVVGTYTEVTTSTDRDGIAIIDTSRTPDANRAFITIDDSLIICADGINRTVSREKYAAFVYTDRDTYFQSDRVNFSGVLTPMNGAKMPKFIYLTTSLSPAKQKIDVSSDGSFVGSFSYEDYVANYRSYVWMNFTDEDGRTVESTHIRVTNEDKPIYTASLAFDRIFYEFGDKGKVTLTASFFDGTPAPGLTFEAYLPFIGNRTVVTDENGSAEISFTCGTHKIGSTAPSTLRASAYLSGYEGDVLEVSASTVYFQSEKHLRVEKERDNVTVRLNKFDTSVINSSADLMWNVFPDNCIGDAADGSITVTLKKITYVKTESGSQYNPITKKVEKNYYYRAVENTVSTNPYVFKDGTITLPCFDREESCSYYYEIKYYDAQNSSTVSRTVGAVKYTDNYRFDYGDYYSLESSHDYSSRVADGDTVEYTLKYGGKTASDVKILHTVHTATSDSRHSYDITKGGFDLEYTKDYIFGARVLAVIFDGGSITTLWVNTPRYDYSRDSTLEITLSPDLTSYKPGDTCVVQITAKNPNGTPAHGSVITIGVVDEACFKLGEQVLDPTGEYFGISMGSPAQNSRFNCFSNHNYYDIYYMLSEDAAATESATEAPGESGGDMKNSENGFDNVTVREYFADNPVFQNIVLDKNGRGAVTFTVPDNITSWRITAAGYTPSESASETRLGTSNTDVISTLPFFINATLSDTYVLGDDISATARVFGTEVVGGKKVSYLAALSDYDGNTISSIEISEIAGEFAHINLGKLDAGSYYLTVKAISGEYSDGVKLPFTVVPDGITMTTSRTLKASEIHTISPKLYPVQLSFTNAAYADYLDVVFYANSKMYNRADTLVARYVAESTLSQIFGTSRDRELEEIEKTLRDYYNGGLISLMSYAEGDVILSAKIAALAPELIPSNRRAEMRNTFYNMIQSQLYQSNVELAACLLGLSALGEPVLYDVYTIATLDISTEAQLYLSFALAILGDYSASRELYDIATDGKFEGEHEINVKASTTEEKIKLTALALMTASVVDTERATQMTKYLMSHSSSLDVYSLEMTSYIKAFYPVGATEATFSYSVLGEEREVTLKPAAIHTLTLGKAAFDSLEVVADDNVLVLCSYTAGVTEALRDTSEAEGAKITKTVEPYDISRGLYKVKVSYEITFDSNYECYTLTDRIPTGARYYGAYEEYSNRSNTDKYSYAYLSNDGGQMMHGYIGMYNPTEKYIEGRDERTVSGEISYLIRAAVSGEFAVSPAIIQNCKTGEYSLSESGYVIIGENKTDPWKIRITEH